MTINDIKHPKIKAWVEEVAKMCQPDAVYVCDGSKEEYDRLMQEMIKSGLATPLKKRPNSVLFRSQPSDVARVEGRTYIASVTEEEIGSAIPVDAYGLMKYTIGQLIEQSKNIYNFRLFGI